MAIVKATISNYNVFYTKTNVHSENTHKEVEIW